MHGVYVCFRVDGDGCDAEFTAGSDDTEGDFSAVRYEDFFKHGSEVPPWLGGRVRMFSQMSAVSLRRSVLFDGEESISELDG